MRRFLAFGSVLLLCAAAAWAASQGPFNPTVGASVGTGPAWSNIPNITGNVANATVSIGSGGVSQNICGSSFTGFLVPSGSVINGIQVSFVRLIAGAGGGGAVTNNVQLTKVANVGTGVGKNSATAWTTSAVTETWGGSSDLWGTTWSAADINGAGFGFLVSAIETTGVNTISANVRNFLITVTYTPPGAVRTQGIIIAKR